MSVCARLITSRLDILMERWAIPSRVFSQAEQQANWLIEINQGLIKSSLGLSPPFSSRKWRCIGGTYTTGYSWWSFFFPMFLEEKKQQRTHAAMMRFSPGVSPWQHRCSSPCSGRQNQKAKLQTSVLQQIFVLLFNKCLFYGYWPRKNWYFGSFPLAPAG